MSTQQASGSCLCGKIKVTATKMSQSLGACHCGMCRKWGGAPLMTVDCVTEIHFDNEDNITVYPSSAWAERGFCSTCGSHLFYRLKDINTYSVPIGIFDNASNISFDLQVYIDDKPAYYTFANKTTMMTEAEVMAMVAGYLPTE